MKNRISNWGKRYFLWSAPTPFWIGWMLAGLPAVIIAFGTIIASIAASIVALTRGRPLLGPLVPPVPGIVFGLCGLGVVFGGINYAVCRRYISYRRELGLYFLRSKGGEFVFDEEGKPVAANPLWGKGIWISLPPTDRPYEIELARGGVPVWGVPVALKVFFKGAFDPQEVLPIRVGGYSCFGAWLRESFVATVGGYPGVWEALREIHKCPLVELQRVIEKMDFSGQPLSNIDHILVEVTPTVTVSF